MGRYYLGAMFICFFLQAGVARQATPHQAQLQALYDSLKNPIRDDAPVSDLSNVLLQRGGQKILFISGTIRFFTPVHGKHYGAVFSGSGTFVVSPATEIERLEFERQTNNKLQDGSYSYEFQRAVLWFADTLFEELSPHCTFREGGVQRPEYDAVQRSLKFATDPSNQNVLFRIIQEMYEPRPEPCLLAHLILDRDGNDLFLDLDMRRFEEVVIAQPFVGYSGGYNFWRDPLCSFHMAEEYAGISEYDLTQEDKRRIDVLRTSVDLSLRREENVQASATIEFKPIAEAPSSVGFFLHPRFEVRSVTNSSGKPLSFLREDKAWETLVLLSSRQDSSDNKITLSYDGDFMVLKPLAVQRNFPGQRRSLVVADLQLPVIYPLHATAWYPSTSFKDLSIFDLTYRVPNDLVIVSAGIKTHDSLVSGKRVVKYSTRGPSLIASFSIGEFEEKVIQLNVDEPPIRVFDVKGGDPMRVGVDLSNSLHFFTYMFGRIPYSEIKVTSSPRGNGQAFPEFIHLPWIEERVGEQDFSISLDRAHEMSHAWWGHTVGWRSYHDQWISEGFAHYSALLYVLYVLKQDNPFFDKLKEWREEIIGARKHALGSGPATGSIWLGYRSSSNKTPDDPKLLIYQKGAWVLHMLRMLMMNLETFKEDAFKAMMKDFYTSFNGMDPGTTDFQHVVEKYMRVDMTWFFYQWVYRNEIPTYKVKHTITKNDQGKWKVNISVIESGVPSTFKMFVPIEIKLKNGTSAFGRMFIDQPTKDFEYELDQEPEKVVVNPFESVLCTIEE